MPVATIDPVRHVGVRLSVPGDPSISHRDGRLAELAERPAQRACDAPGAGCESTLALRNPGMFIVADAGGATALMGRGFEGLRSAASSTDSGNSGRTVHMFRGISARQTAASAGAVAIPYPGFVHAPGRLVA